MKITSMRANHVEEPLGFCLDNLSLSWKAVEAEGKKTVSSRISIALDPDFQTIVSDSGWRGDIDSLSYCPERAKILRPVRAGWNFLKLTASPNQDFVPSPGGTEFF